MVGAVTDPLVPILENVTEPLAPIVGAVTDPLVPVIEDLTTPLAPVIDNVLNPPAPVVEDLTAPLSPVGGKITTALPPVADRVPQPVSGAPQIQQPASMPSLPQGSPSLDLPVSALTPQGAIHAPQRPTLNGPAAGHAPAGFLPGLPAFTNPFSPTFSAAPVATSGDTVTASSEAGPAGGGSPAPQLPASSGSSASAGGLGGAAGGTLFALLVSLAAFGLRHTTRLRLSAFAWRPQAFVAVIERPG